MNIDALKYWAGVSGIVTKLPATAASTAYGTPAFKVHKKLFARLKEDGQTIVVYTNGREKWMQQNPATFFITDHYKDHPLMLVNLVTVKKKDLKTLLLASWQIRASKHLLKELKKSSLSNGLPWLSSTAVLHFVLTSPIN